MPKVDDEYTRVHVLLRTEDYEKIKQIYGKSIGFSAAIRKMVQGSVMNLEARANKRAKPLALDVTHLLELDEGQNDQSAE